MDLNNTIALVTGGASGLGRATTERLLAAGAQVVMVDLNAEVGQQVAKELGER
ncbi:MAG: SDR family NAD(P)-dependent oxidoreductase, partial [Brevibacterium sp.]|nr:SDR family NAD(P)-dependent oxidoreductase [Brevibacterium sp.]